MKSIFSKAVAAAVIAVCFTFSARASVHVSTIDTGKMNKMDHKMDKKMDKKMKKKDKMAKDTMSKM